MAARTVRGSEKDLIQAFGEIREDPAADYVRDNFEPSDRLALVLLNKRDDSVVQRLMSAWAIASDDTQKWLRYMNAQRYDVYVSMNALREGARGRTKADIAMIRHIYLDFDAGGAEAVERLRARDDVPQPNFVLETSPGKRQVVWKVRDFSQDDAEALQRGLARASGADPAATDSSRVLRLPGFFNHKYPQAHYIRAQALALEICGPDRFPELPSDDPHARSASRDRREGGSKPGAKSQSERDWAYALRALSRGETEAEVIRAIAAYRHDEKSNPEYYADLTVRKAARVLEKREGRDEPSPDDRSLLSR